ncbi:hypothetical protein MOE50_04910 [Bacillus inaquosorum]|uniref:hypothetical protein n=1 Tax=Bacillus inaquosorum TaxID=483913 RepID=UPI00227DF464|nr:hypothetical protein [Bacillus inaquosorum]MCY9008342.1 hypothetical protein [Bacillus inaquosorum]MCY9038594.1 hypothetical protein [Bacillus inaquosorum]MCY9043842.1 hypothetical protein [Bacillus inaquosorum]
MSWKIGLALTMFFGTIGSSSISIGSYTIGIIAEGIALCCWIDAFRKIRKGAK